MYRFVLFRVYQNVEVTEDLTSEIFMKALKHFEKYDPKKSEKAWIMTIARNHVINYYRDRKEVSDIDELAFKIEGVDGQEFEFQEDDKRHIYAALGQLSVKDRALVEMKYLQGYRYKDMAEILAKTPGSVRVETHRAMKKLKVIMEPQYRKTQTAYN